MEVKKNRVNKFLTSQEKFNVIDDNEESIKIEGYANKAIVDRGMDLILGKAWDIENFKKNPQLLFQHGHDSRIGNMPIGSVTDVKITEDGLFIKASVMPTDNPDFKHLGKLIKHGILRTFSVGFNPVNASINNEGIRVVDKAELLEVSVVNVPMNQDSTFSISSKEFYSDKAQTKAFIDHINLKGAWVAAAIHDRILELQTDEEDFDRIDTLSAIAESADVGIDTIKDVLSGDINPVPENILDAFAMILDIEKDELVECNKFDIDSIKKQDKTDEEDKKTEQASKKNTSEKSTRLSHFIRMRSEELNLSQDQLASGMGISLSAISQLLSGKIKRPRKSRLKQLAKILKVPVDTLQTYIQEDRKLSNKSLKAEGEEFQECVRNKIPVFIEEGMDKDEAIAAAFSYCKEKNACVITPEIESLAKDIADKYIETKQPINRQDDPSDFGSPQMEAMKQTNVLLGQLIAETQNSNALIEKLIIEVAGRDLSRNDEQQESEEEEETENNLNETEITVTNETDKQQEQNKQILDTIAKYKEHINSKLKKCGLI